ncbi:flagellar hook-associated protein 3 [Hahella sp. KA22]|uniref:flagellar hook-associated protein FlgL n=1 Tax=Hahella sp. KA22 TaxID=1628392 RepID=UPI000FDDFF09|nr:flagellar hook-associated protein FlgL [Hahella sp. KA22]AZZ93330.1 flagellar hook-associated protein 3 [Hahella sp. KA22]QAY56704.1 flagellar hook-associated protein 3 [Hahella sp. KA22]
MRISTQQLFNRGLDNILDVTGQLQKTQLQISSGRRVLTPADDPVASTRILQINQQLSLIDQYKSNINLAENRLSLEDGLLGGVSEVIQRLRELTVQAGDGSQNADDKTFIAAEVRQRLSQLVGMLNTKDPSGEYIFAGFQGKQEPFQLNAAGSYKYVGDEGRRFMQIDANVSVAAGDNGKEVFVNIKSANNTFYTQASPRNTAEPPAIITQGQMIDQELYDAFYPEDMVVVFNNEADVVPPAPNYSIVQRSDGKPILNNQRFATGQPIQVQGVQFEIIGSPQPGDTFFVQSSEKQGLLTTVERLAAGLEDYQDTPAGRQTLTDLLDSTLANFTNAETKLLETRSRLGARLNTIDDTKQLQEDVEVLTKEVLSELQDLDYAEAVSNLTLQNFVLQAAQQSYSRVTSLSLFDLL